MMNLDEAQKQKVIQWINDGEKLSEIQEKIESEFGLTMTYMQVRFLIDDLGVKPKDPAPEPAAAPAAGAPEPPAPGTAPGGGVRVSVDQITRPGALVSGKATFSDGKQADWYLDQAGRLGVVPQEQGYKPSQEDVAEFQVELQRELGRLGL